MNVSFSRSLLYGSNHIYIFENRTQTWSGLSLTLAHIIYIYIYIIYRSFATRVSQLKICDFSGEAFKGFKVLYFSMRTRTTQPLSSGEFCKLHYDTIPITSASANVSFYINNSKMPKFKFLHSCRKRAI